MPTTDANTKYCCPGEEQPISAAVHYARLAAFYPACRECPHRNETGQLPDRTVELLNETAQRVKRTSLLTREGIRGVYLNELSRERAARYAAAFAGCLWQDDASNKSPCDGASSSRFASPAGPTVVVGFDERPHSPDIAVGVARALRTMSCSVIDIGQTTRPCLSFAVEQMQAAAGVFITGSGCGPVSTGLDLETAGAIPVSAGPLLTEIERQSELPQSRPSRQAGRLRAFHAALPYETILQTHFHALRPLKVVCGCSSAIVGSMLKRLFAPLPCELFFSPLPVRERDLSQSDLADFSLLADEVRLHRAHLGLLIDDDARGCAALDERGEWISPRDFTRLFVRYLETIHPEAALVVDPQFRDVAPTAVVCDPSAESVSRAMSAESALFGAGEAGRFWFRESIPACDAIVTLAHLLKLLSRSDAEFSRVVQSLYRSAV